MYQTIVQVKEITQLLSIDSISIIGSLLAFIALLIWHIIRQEKRKDKLLQQYHAEHEATKLLLIDITTKNIQASDKLVSAIEKNYESINNLKDAVFSRNK